MSTVLMVFQLCVTAVMGLYFVKQLRKDQKVETSPGKRYLREMEDLQRLRSISLSVPLSEKTRPACLSDIIGQGAGIQALTAVLSSPHPQHVLLYGPPGVGKTCAARLVLAAAKATPGSPFAPGAPFVEMDATAVRFDERAIADPLLGSVHDPIYQGAGPLGQSGIPQPKPGAVTRAHGGVLFLDEIGELHPISMNKLLKVLEDRLVRFESAYYEPNDPNVPRHIRDMFDNGMPADFRLVGATTREPDTLPSALRSRCMEIFFRPLTAEEIAHIAGGAAERAGFALSMKDATFVGQYAENGRDAVNIVELAGCVAQRNERDAIRTQDLEWVVEVGHYTQKPTPDRARPAAIGRAHGLAVYGAHQGAVLDVEAVTLPGTGELVVTGIVEEEEMGAHDHRLKRKSMARASSDNVRTVLRRMGIAVAAVDVHINFPGGAPVDGPSAGVAMAAVAASALFGRALDGVTAMTGELSVTGEVRPVGAVPEKVQAAIRAGLSRVLIPRANWLERFRELPIEVICVDRFEDVLSQLWAEGKETWTIASPQIIAPMAANPIEK